MIGCPRSPFGPCIPPSSVLHWGLIVPWGTRGAGPRGGSVYSWGVSMRGRQRSLLPFLNHFSLSLSVSHPRLHSPLNCTSLLFKCTMRRISLYCKQCTLSSIVLIIIIFFCFVSVYLSIVYSKRRILPSSNVCRPALPHPPDPTLR